MKHLFRTALSAMVLLLAGMSYSQTTVNFTVADPNCAGIEDIKEIDQFKVFPNPTSGELNFQVQFNATVGKVSVHLYTITGAEVFSKVYENPGLAIAEKFNFEALSAGNYQMKITIGNRSVSQKVVISK